MQSQLDWNGLCGRGDSDGIGMGYAMSLAILLVGAAIMAKRRGEKKLPTEL